MIETLIVPRLTEMTFPLILTTTSLIVNCKADTFTAHSVSRASSRGVRGASLRHSDMKDFVTSQPAAGALFTIVLGGIWAHFVCWNLQVKRLKGTLMRAARTAVSPGRPMQTAPRRLFTRRTMSRGPGRPPVTGSLLGQAPPW